MTPSYALEEDSISTLGRGTIGSTGSIEEALSASPLVSTRDEAAKNPKSSRTAHLFAGMPEARAALIRISQKPNSDDDKCVKLQAIFGGFG